MTNNGSEGLCKDKDGIREMMKEVLLEALQPAIRESMREMTEVVKSTMQESMREMTEVVKSTMQEHIAHLQESMRNIRNPFLELSYKIHQASKQTELMRKNALMKYTNILSIPKNSKISIISQRRVAWSMRMKTV